jgi:hypothetical protein
MASTARYRSGDTNPIAVLCDPTFPIEVGDLLFQDPVSRLAKPASAMKNQGSQSLNQQTFHDQFLGVALQKNGLQPNEVVPLNSSLNHFPANTIQCATTGEFEFACASNAWNPGDLVGAVNNTGNTGLQNQFVAPVTSPPASIGKAVPEAAAINQANTSVGVRITSSILAGGVQSTVPGSSSGTL